MMNHVKTLETMATEYRERTRSIERRIVVCAGTGCIAGGSLKVHEALVRVAEERGLDVKVSVRYETDDQHSGSSIHVSGSGCQGFCQMGPLVTLEPDGILYTKVKVEDAEDIVTAMIDGSGPVTRLLYHEPGKDEACTGPEDIPFYQRQTRRVLGDCGRLDPEDVGEYIAHDGYQAARQAWTHFSPAEVCAQVTESGLRGRGGGGFPTGRKWRLTLDQPGDHKVVICNGDEGDPGAFMDRSVMEGNPHSVVEGMLIAARAVGADRGLVYVRAEYPLAVSRMKKAVEENVAYYRSIIDRGESKS